MTKYGDIIRRIFDNANIDNENSNQRNSVKRDIEDVLNDMFLTAEAPITTTTYNITETSEIQVTGIVEIDQTYTLPTTINSLKTLVVTADHTLGEIPIVGTTQIKVLITNSFGDTLIDYDFVVTDQVVSVEEVPIGFTDLGGATLKLISSLSSGTVDFILDYDTDVTIVQLDPSVYIPLEVVFKVSEKSKAAAYGSKELLEEEFMRWNPNGAADTDDDIISTDLKASAPTPTLENLEFDSRVGYFFRAGETNLELHFKPAIKATIIIRHSFMPVVTVTEDQVFPLHKAFANCLVFGATLKQLAKALMRAKDEIEIVKIKSSISYYTPQYATAISNYGGFNRRKTEVHVIKMFGVADDIGMMLE